MVDGLQEAVLKSSIPNDFLFLVSLLFCVVVVVGSVDMIIGLLLLFVVESE